MGKLNDKVAVVTGASRGIGLGIARAMAAEGASLVVTARTERKLDALVAELKAQGTNITAVPADIGQEDQVLAVFDVVRQQFGKLDLLVNNAGAFNGGPLDQLTLSDWDHVINVNLRGPFICTREAMRIMKPQKSGRIINIGSISAQRVRPNSAPYSTSKHGLWGLTQVTALEGRSHGITCCCLHPGNIKTEGRHTQRPEDAEPMLSVEEIADVVVMMATLPPHVEMLEAIVLPREQLYVGRG